MMTSDDAFCGNVTPIIGLLESKELRNFARKLGYVPNGCMLLAKFYSSYIEMYGVKVS